MKTCQLEVKINNEQQHILRKGSSSTKAENVSIDFDFVNRITLPVLEGGQHIQTK